MNLDLPTLIWTLTLISAVLSSAILAVAWRARIHRGLWIWGLGLAVNAASYPVFMVRTWGWHDLSIVVVNVLSSSTIALHALALDSFQHGKARASSQAMLWGLVGLSFLLALSFLDHDHIRNPAVTAVQAGLSLLLISNAWAPDLQGKRLTGRWVVMTGAVLLAVTLTWRLVFLSQANQEVDHFNIPAHIQALTYFVVAAVLMLNTIGFVLMVMEDAISKQYNLATHDMLTGAYNRLALMDMLKQQAARSHRAKSPIALLMIDIDHFKAVNDQYGHVAGDAVIRVIVQRTQQQLRRYDIVARYGGEEFLAVLPETDAQGAQAVAERIRRAIEKSPIDTRKDRIAVTVSIGVHAAVATGLPGSEEQMIDASDKALYQAKNSGRNRVCVG